MKKQPGGDNKTYEISDEFTSDSSRSMHIASYGNLREIQVAVDIDISNVATVLYDGYVEANNPFWGDIKLNVGEDTISSTLVREDPAENIWYYDIEGDTSSYTGEHTLYFWVRGNRNDAYFDNFRFADADGNLLPTSEVVIGAGEDQTQDHSVSMRRSIAVSTVE